MDADPESDGYMARSTTLSGISMYLQDHSLETVILHFLK